MKESFWGFEAEMELPEEYDVINSEGEKIISLESESVGEIDLKKMDAHGEIMYAEGGVIYVS
jgi:hypothetical protein